MRVRRISSARRIRSAARDDVYEKSAIECFPIAYEDAEDVDKLRDLFPDKRDLRAALESYFHIYDDYAEMTPMEFDMYFKEYMS